MKKSILVIIFISVFIITLNSCKSSANNNNDSNTDEETRQNIERSVAFTASTLNSIGSTVMDSSGGLSSPPLNLTQYKTATYDPSTGWWTFTITLSTGENGSIQIQFLDSKNNFRKFYSKLITKIKSKGTLSGNSGSITYEMEITDLSGDDAVFNGSGSVTYMDITSTFTLNNIIASGYNDYALSGTLTVSIEGIIISINYNGTSKITVTYSYNGHSYTFTIDLETGTIS